MPALRTRRCPGLLVFAWLCLAAVPASASVTFFGSLGGGATGRVVTAWDDGVVADSLVSTYGMTPGLLCAGVTLQSEVSKLLPPSYSYMEAHSHLTLAASGPADSTAPVAQGSLWVNEQGVNDSPALRVQSTLDLALCYQSDQPTLYWAVVFVYDWAPNPPIGPPGDLYLTHPPADSNAWVTWGNIANTGELPRIGEVLEAIRSQGQFSQWYYQSNFSVYIDDKPFTHLLADVPAGIPPRLALSAPRPNPARGAAALDFATPAAAQVRLEIFDTAGRRVHSLVDGMFAAGPHTASWDGTDERGARAEAGVYFARLAAGRDALVRRVVLLP